MRHPGKILKIKPGYNPNSSSIGTSITYFLYGVTGFTLLVNTLLALATSFRLRKKNGKNQTGKDA